MSEDPTLVTSQSSQIYTQEPAQPMVDEHPLGTIPSDDDIPYAPVQFQQEQQLNQPLNPQNPNPYGSELPPYLQNGQNPYAPQSPQVQGQFVQTQVYVNPEINNYNNEDNEREVKYEKLTLIFAILGLVFSAFWIVAFYFSLKTHKKNYKSIGVLCLVCFFLMLIVCLFLMTMY